MEIEKLAGKEQEWNAIYPFLEWVREKRWDICEIPESEEGRTVQRFAPTGKSIEQLLYEYLGIDPEKLEEERRNAGQVQEEQ